MSGKSSSDKKTSGLPEVKEAGDPVDETATRQAIGESGRDVDDAMRNDVEDLKLSTSEMQAEMKEMMELLRLSAARGTKEEVNTAMEDIESIQMPLASGRCICCYAG